MRDVGYHLLVPEQRFRRHQHQRLAELAVQLAPQHMEIIRRRRAVDDLPIVLGAKLEVALEPGRGMLRPLAFIAMRQQQHEARHAQPFALARRDELVDHHLGAIGEVAELRLPQHQRVGLGEAVAIFEAEHGFFGEHRIDDLEVALLFAEMLERRVFVLVLLIHQHRVALGEGAALGVLAGQAHREALDQQRAEGQRLGRRPVDALALVDRSCGGAP